MITATQQPNAVTVASGQAALAASAQVSDDGKALTVQLVNNNAAPAQVTVNVAGFAPASPATVWTLSTPAGGDPSEAGNTPAQPTLISPVQTTVPWPGGGAGLALVLPGDSFTVVTATA
jgi:alpha-L-arabinofuranosidase